MKRFDIIYALQTKQHLKAIERKYHPLVRKMIEEQLQYEPDIGTINRKPLKRKGVFGSEWEIRFGTDNRFRVFYDVDKENGEVRILAIGEKFGNRLFIGGKETES